MRRLLILLLALLTRSAPLLPTALLTVAPYSVFLPMVSNPVQPIVKPLGMGIAWQEVDGSDDTLNADWTYNDWRYCAGDCIKSFPWADLTGYACEETFLLFNEPEWTGAALFTPQEAAQLSREAKAQCPNTRFINGNVTQFGREWLAQYVVAGGMGDYLGIHCYVSEGQPAQDCIDNLESFRARFPDRKLCVTEWNIVVHAPLLLSDRYQFGLFLEYVQTHFDCSAVFTDIWYGATSKQLNLLNADKTPNEIGNIFRNRNN